MADTDLILPTEFDYARHIYHLYVVQTDNRDALQKHLGEHDIQTGIHYPIPIHLQKAYESFGHKIGDFPEAERQANQLLSLPMFPEMTHEQILRVTEGCKSFQ